MQAADWRWFFLYIWEQTCITLTKFANLLAEEKHDHYPIARAFLSLSLFLK